MPRKIELFIQTKEHIQRDTPPTEHMQEAHTRMVGWDNENIISSIHNWLSEDDIKAKDIVEKFARSQNLELVIYDRGIFWDNVRAKFKGIKKTPTVILGNTKMTSSITIASLEEILNDM